MYVIHVARCICFKFRNFCDTSLEGKLLLKTFWLMKSCVREPYFLKYLRSKIFVFDHSLCTSEIICLSKFCGSPVSVKINTPRKLSIAKLTKVKRIPLANWSLDERQIPQGKFCGCAHSTCMWGMATCDPGVYLKLAASIEGERRQKLVEKGEGWAK